MICNVNRSQIAACIAVLVVLVTGIVGARPALAQDCLTMEVGPLVGGEHGTWTIAGGAPGDRIIVVFSTRLGTSVVERESLCATFGVKGINRRRIVGEAWVRLNGLAVIDREIPLGRVGYVIYTQAARRYTCPDECISNIVESVLQ